MKLVVVGLGQCGGRIAEEFTRLNRKAQTQRGLEIVTDTFVVNTDITDLSELTSVASDQKHRLLIGGQKTGGHGVGKINELGAEIAKEDAAKVIEVVKTAERVSEADAFLVVAAAGGGTGSGAIPVVTQHIKECFTAKPVYNLVVLPFEHEEQTEERAVYNAATCLKSAYPVADAVILFDNQKYISKEASPKSNLARINALIVAPFYNLLSTGEEKKPKYIGAKLLDAGDIIQTLVGWTVMGYSQSPVSFFRSFFKRVRDFRERFSETRSGIQVLEEAVSQLSIGCDPADSRRALYLLSGPAEQMSVELIQELGLHLKSLATEAIIRSGDYPRPGGSLDVSLILSQLSDVSKVRDYFTKTANLLSTHKERQGSKHSGDTSADISLQDIPSLL